MQRGEVRLVSLDATAGHEQQRPRPVVMVSRAPFNELTGTPVVLPVTTGRRSATEM
ncbi:MAG: type II toxin-antitoxin system PemK/MazF family toxin [Bryobacterales bacterium]|nr:type II toxin-antitoxin system PemK/MazF family toxin [Bryobacterales bacterium]